MSHYDDQEVWTKRVGYVNSHQSKYNNPVQIPLKVASAETLDKYGRVVRDFDQEEVRLETWPQVGRRCIIDGTGRGGGTSNDEFRVFWEEDFARAEEIPPDPSEELVIGKLPSNVLQSKRTHVLVRDFTSHPDGGQVFFPKTNEPFVQVFGLPGDDVKPSDLVAFYFDGSCGVHIKANVWHQFPYPVGEELAFYNKQSAVFACVMVDFVKEFGTYVSVPLML